MSQTFKKRYIHDTVLQDLKRRMVFVGGPRQVGKTTFAQSIGKKEFKDVLYLNWDRLDDRKIILNGHIETNVELVIFDEIHKYQKWKNHLKGIFDTHREKVDILVTGSARLDLYRRGGDSLFGRYHYYRLHPFSIRELLYKEEKKIIPFKDLEFPSSQQHAYEIFESLLKFGGFPEPFFQQEERFLRRWHNERLDRLVRDDIRDVELVRDISALGILGEILPKKVGSLFSLNTLREDFQVAHKTMALWVDIFERFYYLFRIYPYASTKIKSLRKEPKVYLWDWSPIIDDGARLENLVASHLLKFVHLLYDRDGYKADLHFLRDVEGREVDFLVTINGKPWFAVEVKKSAQEISKHLDYFSKRLKIPYLFQVISEGKKDFWHNSVRVISAEKFLSGLV